MSDPITNTENSKMLVMLTVEELRALIREEIVAALQNGAPTNSQQDVLLTVEMAAAMIGVNRRWLYRHADKLPFVRRINRKHLRISEAGLHRWIAAKKPDSRR